MMRVHHGAGRTRPRQASTARLQDVRPALFEARASTAQRNGLDYHALTDEQLTDDFHYSSSRTSR